MSQEKAQLIAPIDSSFTVPGVTVSGVITATTFDGTITGVADSITQGNNLNVGVVTALSFSGNLTGNAGGLTGSPNTTAGVVTATSFVGDLTGNATSLTGSPNLNLGVTTASSFVGAVTGNAVGNVTGDALSATVTGVTTSNNISVGVVTATSFRGDGTNISGVAAGPVTAQTQETTYSIDVTASGSSNYTLSGTDRNGAVSGSDPTVTVEVGDTLNFVVDASGHPFYIRVSDGGANVSTPAATNQGSQSGTVSWTPNTAGTYYYQCGNHAGMIGTITVSATTTIDLSAGNLIYFNQTADTTVSFANSENGNVYIVRTKDDTTTARSITWPNSVNWNGGVAPTPLSFADAADYQIFQLITRDEGVTWYGEQVYDYSTIMESSGSAWSWGNNEDGMLGLNQGDVPGTQNFSSPVQISTEKIWVAITATNTTAAGIKRDGTLWTWGYNQSGQLGQNQGAPTKQSSPTQVGTDTTWSNVSFGTDRNIMATKTDGTLWTWGLNEYGQCGINGTTSPANAGISSPTQVPGTTWTDKISAGYDQSFAIKTDGTLWGWGFNESPDGTIGVPGNVERSSPTQIGTKTDWVFVNAGSACCGAIRNTDDLFVWGVNEYGQLGLNNKTRYTSPKQIPGAWQSVSLTKDVTAYASSGGIQADGTLWKWGGNYGGALGQNGDISPNANNTRRSSPVQVGTDTNWNQMDGYLSGTIATKTDGTIWTWGYNATGQLGHNNRHPTNYSSPKQIPGTNWTTTTSRHQLCMATAPAVFVLKDGE